MSRKNKKNEYKKIFDEYDKNKDGFIDKKELKSILNRIDKNLEQNEINEVFDQVSSSGKGIDFDDFLEFLNEIEKNKKRNEINVDEIITAFQYFDRDHNGYISMSELKYILTSLGEKMSNKEVKEIFNNCDLNKDGKIDYKEFTKFWAEQ